MFAVDQKGSPRLRQVEAGFAHILIIILLIVGLGVGLYLVQTRTNLFPKATSNPIVSGPGLIGHWKFDEGSGTTINNSGTAGAVINGTLINGSTFVDGKMGKALSFNGTNTVNFGSNSAIDNLPLKDFTVSMWVNPENCNSTNYIAGKNNGGNSGFYILTSQGGCNPRFGVYFGSSAGGSVFRAKSNSLVSNKWQHLTFVWNSQSRTTKIYIDGVEASYDLSSVGAGNYVVDETYNLSLGNLHPTAANTTKYKGLVDELKIYDFVLSAEQVKSDMNNILPSFSANASQEQSRSTRTSQASAPFATQAALCDGDICNDKFASAGNAPGFDGVFWYLWGMQENVDQPSAGNHRFFRMVGKMDEVGGAAYCAQGTTCGQANIDARFAHDEPKIRQILSKEVNKGGVWVIGNEANHLPLIRADLYANQYKRYHALIKSLDPSAKIAHSGLVFFGFPDQTTLSQYEGVNYYETFNYFTQFYNSLAESERPDIYNVHFYPNSPGDPNGKTNSYQVNLNQARRFKAAIDARGEGSKPIWVTEFGLNLSFLTQQDAINYMNVMIPAFVNENLAQKWFWFIGNPEEPQWINTSLTNANGAPTSVGWEYKRLAKQYGSQRVQIQLDPEADSDSDGFKNSLEQYLGTDPLDNCPDDDNDAAWPPDFNNSKGVNGADFSKFILAFGASEGDGKFQRRYDLYKDGKITPADFTIFKSYYVKSCN